MVERSAPVFVISGAPGSGKSSLAVALMRRFPFGLHIPIDDLTGWVVSGIASPVPEWTEETGRQYSLARRSAADIARRYAGAGFAVAIDDIIFPGEASEIYGHALLDHPVHGVLLFPGLGVALSRNASRTNKTFDPAALEDTIRHLHEALERQDFRSAGWLMVDNSEMTLEETVDWVLGTTGVATYEGV